jgi:hypothetical protein
MAAIIPDPHRVWVKGTEYETATDEYTQDGTCVGIGTVTIMAHARACGVTYASPVSFPQKTETIEELFRSLFN